MIFFVFHGTNKKKERGGFLLPWTMHERKQEKKERKTWHRNIAKSNTRKTGGKKKKNRT
jgi:hypothetical protein